MKKFDYVTSRRSVFLLNVTKNIVIYQHLELFQPSRIYTLQQRASVAYFQVMTLDDNHHLEVRDACVLVGDGMAKLTFPAAADIRWNVTSLYHLASSYHENVGAWSVSKLAPRYYT